MSFIETQELVAQKHRAMAHRHMELAKQHIELARQSEDVVSRIRVATERFLDEGVA